MKRVFCGVFAALLLLSAGCASQPQQGDVYPIVGSGGDVQPYYPPEPIPIVIPLAERTDEGVKVTIHAGLLGMNNEELTEAQVADGFTDAVLNEDGSVTYTIAEDKYDAFVERERQTAYNGILSASQSADLGSVTDITCTEDLSAVGIYVIEDEYLYSTDAEVVFGAGLTAVMGQMYNIDAPGTCVIKVYNEAGDVIDEVIYPDELVL